MHKLPYNELLKKIDSLRESGVPDTDPQIRELKVQLWEYLEKRNQHKPAKITPTIVAVKTVVLNPKTLGQEENPKTEHGNKYFLLGIILAIAAIIYKFWFNQHNCGK